MFFNSETITTIDNILENATNEGRQSLYEYEVYEILKAIGVDVPKYIFIEDPQKVLPETLNEFGNQLILKVISPNISRKQSVGGVKKATNGDYQYIQYLLNRMKEEVLSNFGYNDQPKIRGYLIVEYIEHTQALGSEILLGFKDDPAFGPVLTLSKGGDDAEFFAKYFSPANLYIPPFEADVAHKMLQNLKIKHKYQQMGKLEYLELMSKTASLISKLAYTYSFIASQQPRYTFKSFEVNPFAFSSDSRFVAISGAAEFKPVNDADLTVAVPQVNTNKIDKFFHPKGIAIVGISSSEPNKLNIGKEIADSLLEMNRNDIYFVNPKGGEIEIKGKIYPLYQKLEHIPENIDLVIYAAPSYQTIDFTFELRPQMLDALIITSGIPPEFKYQDFVKRLKTLMPPDVRVIGPNCKGVFFAPDNSNSGLNTLFIEDQRLHIKYLPVSNTALLTQSGALAVTAIDKLQNTRIIKAIVSFGNKLDVNISDLLAYFAKVSSIDVISLYLESLDPGEGRLFFQTATSINKPIILYTGRTETSVSAASHPGSMIGNSDVFKAACQQAGIILANNIEEYYDLTKTFALLAKKRPLGVRIAGVVNAGFESIVRNDELENLQQAQLSPETMEKLKKINNHDLVTTDSPFFDITPMADDQTYADSVEAILEDEGVDCVLVAIVPHAASLKTAAENCYDANSIANKLVALSKQYDKPIVISVNAGRYYQSFVSILEENRLPVYNDIRSAIKSLEAFVAYKA
ncbi:MAG TPA: acetate--CoA ligase family protein [Bacillota bacterium]|nr:acetate--CoA ligase family protein [Bacillota bacterium]HOL10764.1 acetate--CoA ligase family protein [Bacillota bacterium]HPO98475.1 acetate--CoA ligase family protein [Bacillota bacterium]